MTFRTKSDETSSRSRSKLHIRAGWRDDVSYMLSTNVLSVRVLWADPLLLDPFGGPVAAKLKHPNRREYSAPTNAQTSLSDFAERAVPFERVAHAREYLEASGKWPEDAEAQVEKLVRRVIQDVAREVAEYDQWGQRARQEANPGGTGCGGPPACPVRYERVCLTAVLSGRIMDSLRPHRAQLRPAEAEI